MIILEYAAWNFSMRFKMKMQAVVVDETIIK